MLQPEKHLSSRNSYVQAEVKREEVGSGIVKQMLALAIRLDLQ